MWQGLSRHVQGIAAAHRDCLPAPLPPTEKAIPGVDRGNHRAKPCLNSENLTYPARLKDGFSFTPAAADALEALRSRHSENHIEKRCSAVY